MKYLKSILVSLIIFFVLNLGITIISYFDLLSNNIINILKIIVIVITFISSGFSIGYQFKKNGIQNGLKISLIFIIVFTVLSFIPGIKFSFKTIIYYVIIILLNTLGSIIGTNIKKATK